MNIIKVNYNNASVKRAKKIFPLVFCYKFSRLNDDNEYESVLAIEIDPKIAGTKSEDEVFYKSFIFEIYVNGEIVSYLDRNVVKNEAGRYYVEVVNYDNINSDKISIQVQGKYYNDYGTEYSFVKNIIILENYFTCSEELFCSEYIFCNDCIYGYYIDGVFYLTRTGQSDSYEYDDEIDPTSYSGIYVDYDTHLSYKWNSNSNEYQLLY